MLISIHASITLYTRLPRQCDADYKIGVSEIPIHYYSYAFFSLP